MRFVPAEIPDVICIVPDVHRDARGFFLETYHAEKYAAGGIDARFVQDNHSHSAAGTIRGLHLQRRRPQGKLIRVIEGEIFDVAVDVRRGSPTFGRWVGVRLSAQNFEQCYIPPGFAHGFAVTSPVAQVEYKCTELYDAGDEIGIVWNDPSIAVAWPVDNPSLSERDRKLPMLSEIVGQLPEWKPALVRRG
jgi:dTDP-4-dehydrorhamnose 3,5-epimerase